MARRFHPAVVVMFAGRAQARGPFHLTVDGAADLDRAFTALGQRERLLPLERGRAMELPAARQVAASRAG